MTDSTHVVVAAVVVLACWGLGTAARAVVEFVRRALGSLAPRVA